MDICPLFDGCMAIIFRELLAVSSLDLRLNYNGDHDARDSGIVWVQPTDVVNAAEFVRISQ